MKLKNKLVQATIIGLFIALGLIVRPQIVKALDLSVVGWGEDDSITTDMVANNASEDSRIVSWTPTSTYNIDTSSASSGTLTIDTGISLTVPEDKAYYYQIIYEGDFFYLYSERNGSTFRADLDITPLSDTTPISDPSYFAVKTGFREDWLDVGGNSFWASPFNPVWIVRLSEGTHDLKFKLDLDTDGSMDYGHVNRQRVQVMRLL